MDTTTINEDSELDEELRLEIADAAECGQSYCPQCRHYLNSETVCAANHCPTPKTLFRRCADYRARES